MWGVTPSSTSWVNRADALFHHEIQKRKGRAIYGDSTHLLVVPLDFADILLIIPNRTEDLLDSGLRSG